MPATNLTDWVRTWLRDVDLIINVRRILDETYRPTTAIEYDVRQDFALAIAAETGCQCGAGAFMKAIKNEEFPIRTQVAAVFRKKAVEQLTVVFYMEAAPPEIIRLLLDEAGEMHSTAIGHVIDIVLGEL